MTINGPEFSNEEHGSAGLRSSKVSKKASNGPYCLVTRVLTSHCPSFSVLWKYRVTSVVFPIVAYQVPPSLLPAVEHATRLNVSNFEPFGPYQCTRMHPGRCIMFSCGLFTFLQSANGGTVMPTAVCALPDLNIPCAQAPASSLQFVDEQELLSALWNSSHLSRPSSCLYGFTSYFTGCPCGFVFGLLGGGFVFVAFWVVFLFASQPGW